MNAPRDHLVIFRKIYTALWDARAGGDSDDAERQPAPPHRGGIHAREIRILRVNTTTFPAGEPCASHSNTSSSDYTHLYHLARKRVNILLRETSQRDSDLPRCHFSRPPRERKLKNGTVYANHASPRGDSLNLLVIISLPLPLSLSLFVYNRAEKLSNRKQFFFARLETLKEEPSIYP